MRRVLEPGEVASPIVEECGYSQECSACCNQDSTLRYFDYDAAHDGGWYGDDGANRIAKDDLVLCEECIREPAEKLGWVQEDRMKELNLKFASENEELKKELAKAQDYSARLEDLFDKRPEKLSIDHRHKPRPARTGAPA